MKIKSAPFLCLLSMAMLSGCSDDSTPSQTCDESLKPSADCVCNHGEWSCTDKTPKCPDACPDSCNKDGKCPADETDKCPSECPDNCDENGECPQVTPQDCPDECSNHCDESGTCLPDEKVECPEQCPDNCDANRNCLAECPAECADSCVDGVCPEEQHVTCPEACPDACDPEGQCIVKCPEECNGKCNDDGLCQDVCPEACPENCIDESTCPVACPEACPNTCNEEGICPCPETCETSCNHEGKCQCPETCTTSCNDNGVCLCPDACKDTCNKNGECPVMCGDETVEEMYFLFPENDLLVPGFDGRQAVTIPIYIKTNKKTYKNTEAPCEIVLKSADSKIMKVAMKDNVPTFSPVAAGRTTGTAAIKGQSMTATVKINVLNPDNLKDNVAKKNSSGKLIHVYKGPFNLNRSRRVCQGFDFNTNAAPTDSDYVYFTQLSESPISKSPFRTHIVVFPDKLSDLKIAKKAMSLYHFGHQGMNVEHTDTQDYIWLGSYGTLKNIKDDKHKKEAARLNASENLDQDSIDKGFGSMQTIARVPFEAAKSYYPEDVEHYYLPPVKKDKDENGNYKYFFHKLEPALDVKNNRFLLRAKNTEDDSITYIKVYYLDKIREMPLSDKKVTLANKIRTFDSDGKVVAKTISTKVKDLSTLKPIHEFEAKSFPGQAVTINNGIIYAVTNQSKELSEGVSKKPGDYTDQFRIIVKVYTQGGKELASYNLQNS
ncbi:MAG: hypothetical protein J6A01_00535, partial [Proteobacteria bacterium]|nr:hypothetical protein [Pseudomonadota bacterium]